MGEGCSSSWLGKCWKMLCQKEVIPRLEVAGEGTRRGPRAEARDCPVGVSCCLSPEKEQEETPTGCKEKTLDGPTRRHQKNRPRERKRHTQMPWDRPRLRQAETLAAHLQGPSAGRLPRPPCPCPARGRCLGAQHCSLEPSPVSALAGRNAPSPRLGLGPGVSEAMSRVRRRDP